MRATTGGRPVKTASVEGHLRRRSGEDLPRVRTAMKAPATSRGPADLEREAYALHEQFRPSVPRGRRGWGAKGGTGPGAASSARTLAAPPLDARPLSRS